jgi:ribonuclease VapC
VTAVIVDPSALLSVIFEEPDSARFNEALLRSDPILSCASRIEAAVVVQRRLGPRGSELLSRLLITYGVRLEAVDAVQTDIALSALANFGKGRGRSPASLNFGDLFSYALAKARDLPLLYKGKDFGRTDVVSALDVLAREEEK